MSNDKNTIISDIEGYIATNGGKYNEWYVGITNDKDRRVFGEHKVNKDTDAWITRGTNSVDIATEVEDHFTKVKDTDGRSGGGIEENSTIVYAYKKNNNTNP